MIGTETRALIGDNRFDIIKYVKKTTTIEIPKKSKNSNPPLNIETAYIFF
ncbi:hypothetical protein GCM10020331_090610 [Ectobacillus funiculus]